MERQEVSLHQVLVLTQVPLLAMGPQEGALEEALQQLDQDLVGTQQEAPYSQKALQRLLLIQPGHHSVSRLNLILAPKLEMPVQVTLFQAL